MTSLEEPFVLSSYAVDGAEVPWKLEISALVYAAESSDEGSAKSLGKKRSPAARSIAVHTVQRSGVHLVDVSLPAALPAGSSSDSEIWHIYHSAGRTGSTGLIYGLAIYCLYCESCRGLLTVDGRARSFCFDFDTCWPYFQNSQDVRSRTAR